MRKLGELYAYVVTDPVAGEGVLRRCTPIGTQPLVADSQGAAVLMAPEAIRMAGELGLPLKLVLFVRGEESDVAWPVV